MLDCDVVVARGEYQHHPLPGSNSASSIDLLSNPTEPRWGSQGSGGDSGDMDRFLKDLARQLGLHVIDETDTAHPGPQLEWRTYRSSFLSYLPDGEEREKKTDVLLDFVSQQTELTFTRERRKMPIWVFSEGK
jgi:hypothetical protein